MCSAMISTRLGERLTVRLLAAVFGGPKGDLAPIPGDCLGHCEALLKHVQVFDAECEQFSLSEAGERCGEHECSVSVGYGVGDASDFLDVQEACRACTVRPYASGGARHIAGGAGSAWANGYEAKVPACRLVM